MKEKDKKTTSKYIRNAILFFALVFVTFYIIFKDQDFNEILHIIKNVKIPFVLLGITCMFGYFGCEAINLRRTLKELGEHVSFFKIVKYVLIGFFYSSITPAASGGQPMQVYYMHKDGIKAVNSTLALVLNLLSFQVVTISLAVISIFFLYSYMTAPIIALFTVGILINLVALVLLVVGIFSKGFPTWAIHTSIKVIRKFKISNSEKKIESLKESLEKYKGSAKYIRNNRRIVIRQFITALIQQLLYYSVPFCTSLAFGLSGMTFAKMIGLQAIAYATVSGIPLPGAVGVSEGAAMSIFKLAYGENLITSATLLNRGISFYLFVIISLCIVIYSSFKSKKYKMLKD